MKIKSKIKKRSILLLADLLQSYRRYFCLFFWKFFSIERYWRLYASVKIGNFAIWDVLCTINFQKFDTLLASFKRLTFYLWCYIFYNLSIVLCWSALFFFSLAPYTFLLFFFFFLLFAWNLVIPFAFRCTFLYVCGK